MSRVSTEGNQAVGWNISHNKELDGTMSFGNCRTVTGREKNEVFHTGITCNLIV